MIGVGAFTLGMAILAIVVGCALGGAALLLRRWGTELTGASRVLGHAVLATALLLLVHIVPGALGIVSRWSVLAASLIVLCVIWRATSGSSRIGRARSNPADRQVDLSWVLALVTVGFATACSLVYLRGVWGTPPGAIDALTFHLPDVASWMRTGSLWQIDQFVPQLANGNYPNNGDVLFATILLPVRSAVLVRMAMLPYLPLLGVAVYTIARELGAPRASSVLFAAAGCVLPGVLRPALVDVQTDTLMLFGFAAGIGFLLRALRDQTRLSVILAGLALGISFGTKWYGVPCALAVVVLWELGRLLRRAAPVAVGRETLGLLGLILAAGGFWLLRNWIESGNPVFPVRVAPFGVTLFSAPFDVVRHQAGFTIADYLTSPHILRVYIFPALLIGMGWNGVLLGLSAVASAGIAGWRWRRGRLGAPEAGVLLLASISLVCAVIYILTPYTALGPRNMPVGAHANVRYLMPAVIAAAPLAAWLCGQVGRGRLALELLGLAVVVNAMARVYGIGSGVGLAIGAGLAAAGLLWRARNVRIPWASASASVAVVVALLAAGYWARARFDYSGYAASDPTIEWLLSHAPSGRNVGLAGLWSNQGISPIFPAFGPRLSNRVTYVGPFIQHMLQQYRSRAAFQAALRRGRYDVLIIGLGFPAPRPHVADETWARAAGYRVVARSPRLTLMVGPAFRRPA